MVAYLHAAEEVSKFKKYPDEVGESKIVCIMGFLHIEVAIQECEGKLLAGTRWERIFILADIFTPGVANSFRW